MQYAHTGAGERAVPRIQKVFGLNTSDKSPHCTHNQPAKNSCMGATLPVQSISVHPGWLGTPEAPAKQGSRQPLGREAACALHPTQPQHTPLTYTHKQTCITRTRCQSYCRAAAQR